MPGPKSAQQDALKESKTSKQRAKEYFMNRFVGVQGRIEAGKKKRKEIQLEKLAEGKLEKTDASLSDEEYIDKQLASATQFGKSEEYLREEARRITKNISIAGQMRLLGKKTGTGRFKKESRVKKFFKN